MHLTNANGNLLNSLSILGLTEKPDIREDEITPVQNPQEASEQSGQSGEAESATTDSLPNPSSSSDPSTEAASQPSTTSSNGNSEIDKVIQHYSEKIHYYGPH